MNSLNVNLGLERSPVGLGLRKISQVVSYTDFTIASGSGTMTLKATLPAGSCVLFGKLTIQTAFTGATGLTVDAGHASDTDAFIDGVSVASTGIKGQFVATAAEAFRDSDTAVVLTITGTNLSQLTAGKMLVEIFYLSTKPEIETAYEKL